MANQEKIRRTYTKDMLVKKIVEESKKDVKTVRTVYNTLEGTIFEALSSADPDTDVSIKLFEGISLGSTFIPERTKVNNLTGETITASSKVKPKANITRNYCEKLTNHNE